MPSPLEHHDDEFVARNLYLQLALGLLSTGERFERLVARHAVPSALTDDHDPRDEALVSLALGLAALHRTVRAHCDEAARTAPMPVAQGTADAARVPLR